MVLDFRKMKDIRRNSVTKRKIRKAVPDGNHMFKVNNRSGVSIVNFEQVNAGWGIKSDFYRDVI